MTTKNSANESIGGTLWTKAIPNNFWVHRVIPRRTFGLSQNGNTTVLALSLGSFGAEIGGVNFFPATFSKLFRLALYRQGEFRLKGTHGALIGYSRLTGIIFSWFNSGTRQHYVGSSCRFLLSI